ncbi:MAG: hypothetical protein AMXMBFR58_02940 [Phycisphaerae bacterium]
MGVRALRVRVDCDVKTFADLWRTHLAFNEGVTKILKILLAMRRGEHGDTAEDRLFYQRVARFILARDAKDAVYLLNAVSIRGWKPGTALKMKAKIQQAGQPPEEVSGDTWAHEAAERSGRGQLAYWKDDLRGTLPDSIFQPMLRDAVAYLSGHDELVRLWHDEHAAWLKRKAEWESDAVHQKYLALRPRFEQFEQTAGGKAAKRRGRWHLYLSWLAENPDLAEWRGGPAIVNPISAASREPRAHRARKAVETAIC